MNRQKALNMLGLAMRAGKLVTGEEMTIKEVKSPMMLVRIHRRK
jgi:ribosomal protein L7Ae-like RNA K-turn-binding protein